LNSPSPNVKAQFIVEVPHVKEVALVAEADWAYWWERLHGAGVFPFKHNDKAHLLISATELHSMGRRANELTISLAVCERSAADSPDAFYLVYAFNSSRLFVWIERIFFSTPYYLGRIQLDAQVPTQVRLGDRAGLVLNAHMAAESTPASSREEMWQGKIYLPHHQPGKYFVAKLGGLTDIYPFAPPDTLQLNPRSDQPFTQWLRESNLAGREWRIRIDATHARSKTYVNRGAT
jgi:hypothetical protein